MKYKARRLKRCTYVADRPGHFPIVYRQYDGAGRLLYIGSTTAKPQAQTPYTHAYEIVDHETRQRCRVVIARIRTHKPTASWFDQIRLVTIERATDLASARKAEWEAIGREKPIYNKDRPN